MVKVKNKPAILGRDWLKYFKLDWNSIFTVQKFQTIDPVETFPQLSGTGVGTLVGYQANIMLNTDAKPKFHRPRPIPYALHSKVDAELERMRKEGILKPVDKSEWAAPIVVVRKGDGNVRICGDYKVTINLYIDLDQYPMPNPDDLFSTLAGGKKFSRLDLKQAYQQMLVDPRSQQYLTINTRKGMFTYTRMSFGISSAPSIWQRAIDNVLSGLDGVICYLDDILIVGNSDEQHNQRLFKVLERLNQAGIKLNGKM